MATVYVVNDSGHDVQKAERFGDLVSLTTGKVNVFATDRLTQELSVKLKDFHTATDYVLLSGTIILNVIVMRILMRQSVFAIRVLIYNFSAETYTVRDI